MSAETQPNTYLQGIKSRIGSVELFSDGDRVGVTREIQHAAPDDLGSPIAESVRNAQKDLHRQEHTTDFELYDAMIDLDPELSGAVNAIAQSASNFKVVSPSDDPSERGVTAVEECRALNDDLDGDLMAIDVLRNLVKDGNDINKKVYSEGTGIEKVQSLPVKSMTIVDDRTDLQTTSESTEDQFEDIFESLTQQDEGEEELDTQELNEVFSRDAYVLNEDSDGNHKIIEPHNILHFAIDHRSNWHTDRVGRETYGVWGKSRLEPLEFTIQTKYNTLSNKVAMDDKLIAREIYYINTTELFGGIADFEERKKKAKQYAKEIKGMIEELGPDERPILPEHVNVEVIGPEGKAIDQQPFLEQLNNAIAAALTFPMAGLGRGTTSVKAGEEISSLWAENNIRNLRRSVIRGFEELFADHLKLRHPEWVENSEEASHLGEMELDPEIEVPTLEYEPFKEEDMTEKARQIKLLTETKTMTAGERREHFGLSTDDESLETLGEEYGSLNPTGQGTSNPSTEGDSGVAGAQGGEATESDEGQSGPDGSQESGEEGDQ